MLSFGFLALTPPFTRIFHFRRFSFCLWVSPSSLELTD